MKDFLDFTGRHSFIAALAVMDAHRTVPYGPGRRAVVGGERAPADSPVELSDLLFTGAQWEKHGSLDLGPAPGQVALGPEPRVLIGF